MRNQNICTVINPGILSHNNKITGRYKNLHPVLKKFKNGTFLTALDLIGLDSIRLADFIDISFQKS